MVGGYRNPTHAMPEDRVVGSPPEEEVINAIVTRIVSEPHRHSINGSIYDRHGEYLSDAQHESNQYLVTRGLAVVVHGDMSHDEIREAVRKMERS